MEIQTLSEPLCEKLKWHTVFPPPSFCLNKSENPHQKIACCFFLPWGVMCYQFCDMIFFSLIKRLLQNRLCAENFLANTPYNDNAASGLTSRTEHRGNGIPTESNGRIKWGVDTHTQHTAVRTWQALINWMAFSWFCLFCVIFYLRY